MASKYSKRTRSTRSSSITACPGAPVLEGLSDIRKVDDEVSIIMLTGYGTIETACEAFRNQATDFMTKPPDTDAMLEAVNKNVSLSRAKRARSGLSRELADLNMNLNAELNETRPLAKLGQRSDEIIHDMGNPLTILTCCIELLQTKVDEMKPEADTQWMETLGYIGMIKKSIQHCCGLTDTWRQLRDDISQECEPTAAGPFLNEAVGSLQPLANMTEVALQTDLTGLGAENINIDVVQMRRVVHNLMINAMQATVAGQGKVLIRASASNGMLRAVCHRQRFGHSRRPLVDDFRAVLLDQGKRHRPRIGDFKADRRRARRHVARRK